MNVFLFVLSFGIVAAHDHRIDLFDRDGQKLVWSTEGVAHPGAVVASRDFIAVLDPIANEAAIVEITSGKSVIEQTSETPIGGAFAGGDLYVLDRDARAVERMSDHTFVATGADPSFITAFGDRLFVYTRSDGLLTEITTKPFAAGTHATVLPYAIDFKSEGSSAWFDYATGDTMSVDLKSMKASKGAPAETFSHAFARGFLRGLLGIDLSRRRNTSDVTYNPATRTLEQNGKVIARDVEAHQFATSERGVFLWNGLAVRPLQKIAD